MKRLLTFGMFGVAAASQASILFYGGDFDGRDAFTCDQSSLNAAVYDDFTLSSDSTLQGIFANFISTAAPQTTAFYEIRSGVSAGNGGTLLASGTIGTSATLTGRNFGGALEYAYSGAIPALDLTAGTYWVTLQPIISDATGHTYMSSAAGTNGIGSPLANGNSFYRSGTSFNYAATEAIVSTPSNKWDFSIGVTSHPVPEPASLSVLGLAIVGLAKRRRITSVTKAVK